MTFDDFDIGNLRARPGKKWSTYARDVLPAWLADMDFPVAPAIHRRLLEVLETGDLGYPRDDHVHRVIELFVRRCLDRYRWAVDPDRVEVIADVVQGIRLCLEMFTRPAEGALILAPIYPPFLHATREMRRRADCCVLTPGEERFEIDWARLQSSIRADTRVLLLCNPHNPTGRVFTTTELTRLAELAIEHDLVVVSDEVHSDLVFSGHAHIPFASLGPEIEARTVTLMSASKAFNIAGLRCAMVAFGSDEQHALYKQGPRFTRGALSSLGLHATEAAWIGSDDWLSAATRYLEANRDHITDVLAARLPGIRYLPPQGTYLAWLDCRATGAADNPWQVILERGRLALSDGRDFGPGGEHCVRLNFATSRGLLDDALHRLERSL